MGLDGPVRLFRWRDAANAKDQLIVGAPHLSIVGDLPYGRGEDHAEGITVVSAAGRPTQLLVVYDSPSAARLAKGDGTLSILADLASPQPETSENS